MELLELEFSLTTLLMLRREVTPNQSLPDLTRSVLGSCEIGLMRNGLLEEGMYGLGLREQKCLDAIIQAIPQREDIQ